MNHVLNKIQRMDEIYTGIEKLNIDLINYKELDFPGGWQAEIGNRLEELKCISQELNLEITALLDRIQELVKGTHDYSGFEMVRAFLKKTGDIFTQSYIRFLYDENSYKEELLENYYGTDHEKNALLVYLLQPFVMPDLIPSHTNQVEARIIAQVLSEEKYNVDLINTRYVGEVDSGKYDLIIGEGRVFENLCRSSKRDTKTVYYLTQANSYFANMAELKRLRDFERRNHFLPKFERFARDRLDLTLLTNMDAAVCIGNEDTVSTYQGIFKRIWPINVTGFCEYRLPDLVKPRTGRNFLWYGGAGPIHKGLDLCIEAFRNLPDLSLYIVGELSSEFYEFYKEDIERRENIRYYGFLRKDSDLFREVCEDCDFCVFPSCSEGQSTSVIGTMFAGIIPVCTVETGINAEEAGGFLIREIEPEALSRLVISLSELEPSELEERQKRVYEYVAANHTEEHFRRSFGEIMDELYLA